MAPLEKNFIKRSWHASGGEVTLKEKGNGDLCCMHDQKSWLAASSREERLKCLFASGRCMLGAKMTCKETSSKKRK
jgi:hypothetical protein